jgi:hypothetical protein
MAEAEDDCDAAEATAIFCASLSRAVLLAVAELRAGHIDYGIRVLEVFERRIRRGLDKAQDESDARATRH